MYTLRQFRAHTKKAFDDSAAGHEVVITRGKQSFQLVCLVDLPLGGSSFESTPKEVKPIKKLTPVYTPIKETADKPRNPLPEEPFAGPLFRNKKQGKI